ncbi:B- and T-lymphocyte attenuator-like isoform X2 [Brachyistius frenatus]|uniref:B- and T-lymphocyte attenuator-like isoform X2 n=1 Tax=Brachyistius frenatus TaxID=100188 RepID=UPI0037E7B5CD
MTGGFRRVSIMRADHRWTVLHVSILMLLLTVNVDSEETDGKDCSTIIKVRRKTVYNASLGQELRIHCSVSFCNNSTPTVSWIKQNETSFNVSSDSHIKTQLNMINSLEGESFLIFQTILRSDSGEYLCQSGNSISHLITVSVYVSEPKLSEDFWMYVYSAAGIFMFVIIVIIISVISMRGCKGKSKKETDAENQYIEIPMVEQPFPHMSRQPSPRGSQPRSTKRKMPPRQPNDLRLSGDHEQRCGQTDREGQRNTVQEESTYLVYAALNHQLPARAAAWPLRPEEERSEYAAIRVG